MGEEKTKQTKKQNIKKSFLSEENKEKNKDRTIGDIWTLFERKKLDKKKNLMKDQLKTTIRDIGPVFEQEEDYYKPKRVNKFWNNNYIEYESNGDKETYHQMNILTFLEEYNN